MIGSDEEKAFVGGHGAEGGAASGERELDGAGEGDGGGVEVGGDGVDFSVDVEFYAGGAAGIDYIDEARDHVAVDGGIAFEHGANADEGSDGSEVVATFVILGGAADGPIDGGLAAADKGGVGGVESGVGRGCGSGGVLCVERDDGGECDQNHE